MSRREPQDDERDSVEAYLLLGLHGQLASTHLLQTQIEKRSVSDLLVQIQALLKGVSTGPPQDCLPEIFSGSLGQSAALTEAFGRGVVTLTSSSSSGSSRADDGPEPDAPLQDRIEDSLLPSDMKREVLRKLRKRSGYETDNLKVLTWAETLLQLPLNKMRLPPEGADVNALHLLARQKLDQISHGQEQAKEALLERYFQWLVKPMDQQRPLALIGPPGCGKTTLLLRGCQQAMQRPVRLFALGAATDASSLVGHAFTYEGSQPGFIVDALIETQCMNPILVLDELDKVSSTNRGDEVLRCLLQLTDPLQTQIIRDRYLGTMLPLDLSACLLAFSMNSIDGLVPALLDRLELITIRAFNRDSIRAVVLEHLFPAHAQRMELGEKLAPLSSTSMTDAIEQLTTAALQHGLRFVDLVIFKACLRAVAHLRDCQSAARFRGEPLWESSEEGLRPLAGGIQTLLRVSAPSSVLLSYIV